MSNKIHSGISQSGAKNARSSWSLSQQAFEKLLCSFSTDREDAGAQYEVIRRKLVRFFEWRGIDSADEHADETINRVARRLDEGQVIENLKGYFYGVARIIFMEQLKERERSPVALDDAPQGLRFCVTDDPEPEARVVCFEKCLESLPADNRKLIISYYQEEKRVKIELRQEMANRLQIPLNALRIRAHRIRVSLEKCISNCLQMNGDTK